MTHYGLGNSLIPIHRNTVAAPEYMNPSTIYRARLVWGAYTRIAKKLKLGPNGRSHVSRVASGERRSQRVTNALRQEASRIERLVEAYERKHGTGIETERAA